MKSLRGDVVLVTGGGGGVGRQLAVKLARLGAKVVVWDISKEGWLCGQFSFHFRLGTLVGRRTTLDSFRVWCNVIGFTFTAVVNTLKFYRLV